MKKKLLSLLLVGSMAASILAGCGAEENAGTTEASGKTEEAAEETGKAENEEKTEGSAEKELTTVTVLAPNFQNGNVNMDTSQWEEYPISEIVIKDLEEIGIRLELELLNTEGYADAVKARMAAGTNLPDLIAYSYWDCEQADAVRWVESGLLYDVDELLNQYDADGSIKAFYNDKVPGLWEMNTLTDGHNYWFANGTVSGSTYDVNTKSELVPANNNRGVAIREDWVKAVGEEVKEVYSTEELSTLLKKIYDEDANGNGKSDEVIYINPSDFKNGVAAAFGLTDQLLSGYYEGENEVFSNFKHENFSAYVSFLNDLYEYGVLDPITLSVSQAEMTAADIVSCHTTSYAVWAFEGDLPEGSEGYYAPIILDQDGNAENGFVTIVDNYRFSNSRAFFIPKTNENPEPVIRLLDYVFTEKYQDLVDYGREGVNYEITEDGWKLWDIPNCDTTLETTRFVMTGVGFFALPRVSVTSYAVSLDYGDMSTPTQRKDHWFYETYKKKYHPYATEVTSTVLAMTTDEEQAILDEKTTTLATYANELLADLILGNKSLDDLDKYLEEFDKLGLQDFIDVMQARRDRVVAPE